MKREGKILTPILFILAEKRLCQGFNVFRQHAYDC